jgi:hypothetical protein
MLHAVARRSLTNTFAGLFDVTDPQLSGFLGDPTASTISGAGANLTVAPGGTGTFGWLIAPLEAAALTGPQGFSVGGSISCAPDYSRNPDFDADTGPALDT